MTIGGVVSEGTKAKCSVFQSSGQRLPHNPGHKSGKEWLISPHRLWPLWVDALPRAPGGADL